MATLVAIKFPTVGGATNLSHEQEEELHDAFSHDEETVAE
jgi:hypothetical protein